MNFSWELFSSSSQPYGITFSLFLLNQLGHIDDLIIEPKKSFIHYGYETYMYISMKYLLCITHTYTRVCDISFRSVAFDFLLS